MSLQWSDPWVLALIPVLVLLLWSHQRQGRLHRPTVGYSDLSLVEWSRAARPSWEGHVPLALFALGMALVIAGMARPQMGLVTQNITSSGIDILLCIDASSSMEAQDLQPNRLAAALEVSRKFVADRPSDRIGLVVYSAVALTQCPLTSDHGALENALSRVQPGMVAIDGTAVGSAIATCVNRLKELDGKSRIVILLTDGRNNTGEIDPLTAAELAAQFGVKIYTIGVGTHGEAPYVMKDAFGTTYPVKVRVDIDEGTLTKIAEITGGRYFRATDNRSLFEIYGEIDRMEKTEKPQQEIVRYRELYRWLVVPGTLLLGLSVLLARTLFREVP
ncbi:MAG: VWA domain-containing protein [Armatimonadetes bacterium]|nr:VWA domain-containing protein [Armatimonadota bacterium]